MNPSVERVGDNSIRTREAELERFDELLQLNHHTFSQRVRLGILDGMTESDKKFVLALAFRKGLILDTLHNIADDEIETYIEYFKKLLEAGFDKNALDHRGRTLLSYCRNHGLFVALRKLGFEYIHPQLPAFMHCVNMDNNSGIKLCKNLIIEFLGYAEISDFKSLSKSDIQAFHNRITSDDDISYAFFLVFDKWQKSDPKSAASFLLRDFPPVGYFIKCLKEKKFTGSVIEHLFTDNRTINALTLIENLNEGLLPILKRGPYTLAFHALLRTCPTVISALIAASILKSTSLKDINTILWNAKNLIHKDEIPSTVKTLCVQHVNIINTERTIIWMEYWTHLEDDTVDWLLDFGFDLNACDANGRNILFAPQIYKLRRHRGALKIDQRDYLGHNALDHFILNVTKETNSSYTVTKIKKLLHLGLTLSPSGPYLADCQRLFPGKPYRQARLAFLVNNRCLITALEYLKKHIKIIEAGRKIPVIRAKIELISPSSTYTKTEYWKIQYSEEELNKLDGIPRWLIGALSELWDEKITVEAVVQVPWSPRASVYSFLLAKKFPNTEALLNLSPNLLYEKSIVKHLFQHFYTNPKVFGNLVALHLKCTEIQICHSGKLFRNYASFFYDLLLSAPVIQGKKVFNGHLLWMYFANFKPQDCLWISKKSNLKFENSTLISTKGDTTKVYNIVPKNRSTKKAHKGINNFRRLVVSRSEFRSSLPIDIEVSSYREVSDNVKERINHFPMLAYHYIAKPDDLRSIFTIDDNDFKETQYKWLTDYGRLVSYDMTPQLMHSDKENQFWKKHVFLNDLKNYFLQRTEGSLYNSDKNFPFIGTYTQLEGIELHAGGLNPRSWVSEKKFVNLDSGLSHFNHMERLARGLFINLFVYLKRIRVQGLIVDWTNAKQIKKVIAEIVRGFVGICGTYADRNLTEFKQFVKGSELNWKRMAQQILFWSDVSKNGYMTWLRKGRLPEEIFDKEMQVEINLHSLQEFISNNRFEVNGEECIGIPHGPLGWVDFENAVHAFTLFAVIYRASNQEMDEKRVKIPARGPWSAVANGTP